MVQHGGFHQKQITKSTSTIALSYGQDLRTRRSTLSKVKCVLFSLSERNMNAFCVSTPSVKDGTLISWK